MSLRNDGKCIVEEVCGKLLVDMYSCVDFGSHLFLKYVCAKMSCEDAGDVPLDDVSTALGVLSTTNFEENE